LELAMLTVELVSYGADQLNEVSMRLRQNQPVERMAAGARCLQYRAVRAAATAHFFR
jgi:hypothetical protein